MHVVNYWTPEWFRQFCVEEFDLLGLYNSLTFFSVYEVWQKTVSIAYYKLISFKFLRDYGHVINLEFKFSNSIEPTSRIDMICKRIENV